MAGSLLAGKKGILIPLVLAILAVLLMYQYINKRERQLMLRGQPVPVLVAIKDIPRMTKIDETLVRRVQVPRQFLQPGAITEVKDVVGQVTISPILKGEQVMGTKLVAPGVETGLAIKVPKGLRAISMAIDDVTGVAGLIKPGNFVDVLGTFEFGDGKKSDQKGYTIYQNVLVLAVSQDVGPESQVAGALTMSERERGASVRSAARGMMGARRSATVTLALAPEQAQGLVLVQNVGRLSLALRSLFEGRDVKTLAPSTLNSTLGIQDKVMFQPRPWHEIRGTRVFR